MKNHTVFLILLTIEIFIPNAESLKSKRRVIRSLQDRLRSRFNASVAEIAFQDQWQRSVIAVSMLSNDRQYLEREVSHIRQMCQDNADIQVIQFQSQWY